MNENEGFEQFVFFLSTGQELEQYYLAGQCCVVSGEGSSGSCFPSGNYRLNGYNLDPIQEVTANATEALQLTENSIVGFSQPH